MSLFGSWKCPNCGTIWTGSIGWDSSLFDDMDKRRRLLLTMCGCTEVEDPVDPEGSFSVMDVVISDKRKELIPDENEETA